MDPRAALGCVLLCVALQWANSADRRCLRDLPLRVRQIWSAAPVQRSDSALYTPTTHNYTNCPAATLRCFADELQVLIKECEITNVRLVLSGALYRTSRRFAQTDDCLHCELLQERNPRTFLDQLMEVVQKMNSEFC